jgi:hypothetical protein
MVSLLIVRKRSKGVYSIKDDTMKESYAKLHPLSFGLALGLVWGFALFCIALMALSGSQWGQIASDMVSSLSRAYFGYKVGFLGGSLGFLWGLLDLGIAGLILAWLYNKMLGFFV